MGVEAPWEEEPLFTQMLMHDPAKKEDFHKIDLFHTISLGIGKPFAASAVSILQELMAGGSIEQRLKEFTSMYLEYCRDFGLQFWVIVQRCSKFFLVCSLAWLWPPGFPITCMHNKPSGVPSQGKSENELCPKDRQGFAWMDWLCRACWELVQGCIHNILVPIFGTPLWDLWFGEWWGRRVSIDSTCGCDNFEKYNLPWKIWKVLCSPHFFLMYPSTCKASSVRAVNYFMSSLYKSNALICRDSVASVIAAGRHFLRGYARLAFLAHRQKVARFALVPKCHMFFHVVHRMHQETQISEFILNPIVFQQRVMKTSLDATVLWQGQFHRDSGFYAQCSDIYQLYFCFGFAALMLADEYGALDDGDRKGWGESGVLGGTRIDERPNTTKHQKLKKHGKTVLTEKKAFCHKNSRSGVIKGNMEWEFLRYSVLS